MAFCSACGRENEDEARFCTACGQQMPATAPPPPTQPATPVAPPQPPSHYYQPVQQPISQPGGSGMGVAGMILGIIGIVFAFIPLVGPFIAFPCIAVGMPLSIIGFVRNRRRGQGKGMAIAGMVCNAVALLLTIISVAITVAAISEADEELSGNSSSSSSSSGSSSSSSESSVEPSAFSGEGSFEVGVDISPGRYRTNGPGSAAFGPCTFARMRTAGASFHQIDEVLDIQQLYGQASVTIMERDGGFVTQNCKEWTPIGQRTATPTARPTVNAATVAAASDATHVAKATQAASPTSNPIPATTRAPAAPPAATARPLPTPTQDIMTPQESLGPRTLWVGAIGNLGLEPGTYQYRDDNGNETVQGNDCYLYVNLGQATQERIKAEPGEPFSAFLQPSQQYVTFEGHDGGCTGDASVGYGLYLAGSEQPPVTARPAATSPSATVAPVPRPTPKPVPSTAVPRATSTPAAVRLAPTPTPLPIATPTPTPDTDAGTTLEYPYPAGSTMQGTDGTETVVTGVNNDAWQVVLEENQFNDPPEPGNRFYMVRVEVSNVSAPVRLNVSTIDFELIGGNRVVYKTFQHSCGVVPDELWGEIYQGGSVQGNLCFEVGANEGGFVLIHSPGFFGDNRRFLSLE